METEETIKNKKDSIKCCYKLSDTDVNCLLKLIEISKPITSNELAEIMGFSKTTAESSLKKLIDSGLISRIKIEEKKIGRPKFTYKVIENIWEKISKDLRSCANRILSAASA
ncbi:helix-turn-helix domain-containing protein [Acidianus manzaensis]|uniref:TrmB family transcriptional regulator n=1 Tax=Acidianus manzaensis TaxID=282676 RepID=A0A1W6K2E2_9CREN|nr:helix-turn-helix domain-containing protein [Acidianus manzaensis]ARM76657.1 TrmB family transcriptional regulator [Acidianus manzaensis]